MVEDKLIPKFTRYKDVEHMIDIHTITDLSYSCKGFAVQYPIEKGFLLAIKEDMVDQPGGDYRMKKPCKGYVIME